MPSIKASATREVVFISKATPGDDEFVLWLAPRLESAGYTVFADILSLEPGARWRQEVTNVLQDKAIKLLLCCRDSTLRKNGVDEEIAIAEDRSKELNDPRFIIPLRLKSFKKVLGIGGLQYVDFAASWANGLHDLLETFEKQGVPRHPDKTVINPNWDAYRKRLAIKVEHLPETLTTNWLRIASIPDTIRYYQPSGALDHSAMQRACDAAKYPAEVYLRGFFSFASPDEINRDFGSAGKFAEHSEHKLVTLLDEGSQFPNVRPREAKNMVSSMFRKSWESYSRSRGLYEYAFSNQLGFHITDTLVPIGKRISWGRQGQRRSSMLCNVAGGKVWQYGVSVIPQFWPFPHFRVKSRVLFAELAGNKVGAVVVDKDEQHRFRRRICKGWRNKQWHGRLMALLELLSGDAAVIDLPLSASSFIRLDGRPILVTSPVTTPRPDEMPDDGEEQDASTLGNVDSEEDE